MKSKRIGVAAYVKAECPTLMTARTAARPIVVAGSINSDLRVLVDQLPLPGQTVFAASVASTLGGKGANQAVAAARLGAKVHFVGSVGGDDLGHELRAELARNGVTTDLLVTQPTQPSGQAIVAVDASGENQIIVVRGANSVLDPAPVLDSLASLVREGQSPVVLTQGEMAAEVIERVAEYCAQTGLRFVLNLAPVVDLSRAVLECAAPLIVNEHELIELAARNGLDRSGSDVVCTAAALAHEFGQLVVTLGAKGALLCDGSTELAVPVKMKVNPVDTTGAGDAFVGALVAALVDGRSLIEATEWGVACGAWSVGKPGTVDSYPSWQELLTTLQLSEVRSHS